MEADTALRLREALEENEKLQEQKERLEIERNEQAQKISDLNEQLENLLRRLYGRKSERYENPNQTDRFDELGVEEPCDPKDTPEEKK